MDVDQLLAMLGGNMVVIAGATAVVLVLVAGLVITLRRRKADTVAEDVVDEARPDPQQDPVRRRRPLVADPGPIGNPLQVKPAAMPVAAEDTSGNNDLAEPASEPLSQLQHESNRLAAMEPAELISQLIEANLPPPPHEGPLPEAIEAARWRPIVFRQFLPEGPGKDGLSFYGGQPIGPADFVWPRSHGSKGVPLTFIMQWDCAQLAVQDATGLLPKDGVLYCFLNLDWGNHEEFIEGHAFIHRSGPTDGWSEIALPQDARPVFGAEGAWQMEYCTSDVENAQDFYPRTLARFPFEPIAMNYPVAAIDLDEGERLFWSDKGAAEAVLRAHKSGIVDDGELPYFNGRTFGDPPPPFGRPFAAFPHDFGAIRILAAQMIKKLARPDDYVAKIGFPDLSDEERAERFASWRAEAKELYRLGCQRPLGQPVDQSIADDIWQWVVDRRAVVDIGFDRLVKASVDLSLGSGSKALASVPEGLIEQAMNDHALAREFMIDEHFDPAKHGTREEWARLKDAGELDTERQLHARTPAHMFGPPSYVQGDVEEMIDDHLLLLELPGNSGPEHYFGEGVLQYLIHPEDLAARRFDRVKSVLSGY